MNQSQDSSSSQDQEENLSPNVITKRKIGRRQHDEWDGYDEVRDTRGVIIGCICQKCKERLSKHTKDFMKHHRDICQGPRRKKSRSNDQVSAISFSEREQDQNVQVNVTRKTSTEKNQLLLKLLLTANLDFSVVNTEEFKAYSNALDQTYELPTGDQLVNLLKENLSKQANKEEIDKVLYVFSETTSISIYLMSVLRKKSGNFLYIGTAVLDTNDDNIVQDLDSFFDFCVKKVLKNYNIQLRYLMFDGTQNMEPSKTVICDRNIKFTYHRYYSFNRIFHTCQEIIGHDNVTVAELKSSCEKSLLPQAMEILCTFIDEQLMGCNNAEQLFQSLQKQLNPINYVSNYLNPQFKGRLFMEIQFYSDMVRDFFLNILPPGEKKDFNVVAQYKLEAGIFKNLFIKYKDDPTKFWDAACMEVESSYVPELAMEVISLPSCYSDTIEVKKIYDSIETLPNGDPTLRRVKKQLLIDKIINTKNQ